MELALLPDRGWDVSQEVILTAVPVGAADRAFQIVIVREPEPAGIQREGSQKLLRGRDVLGGVGRVEIIARTAVFRVADPGDHQTSGIDAVHRNLGPIRLAYGQPEPVDQVGGLGSSRHVVVGSQMDQGDLSRRVGDGSLGDQVGDGPLGVQRIAFGEIKQLFSSRKGAQMPGKCADGGAGEVNLQFDLHQEIAAVVRCLRDGSVKIRIESLLSGCALAGIEGIQSACLHSGEGMVQPLYELSDAGLFKISCDQLVEGGVQAGNVAGERQFDSKLRPDAGHHHPVGGGQFGAGEPSDGLLDAFQPMKGHGLQVEEKDKIAPVLRGRGESPGGKGGCGNSAAPDLGNQLFLGAGPPAQVEERQPLELAVLEDLNLLKLQVRDELALPVGDDQIDQDDLGLSSKGRNLFLLGAGR